MADWRPDGRLGSRLCCRREFTGVLCYCLHILPGDGALKLQPTDGPARRTRAERSTGVSASKVFGNQQCEKDRGSAGRQGGVGHLPDSGHGLSHWGSFRKERNSRRMRHWQASANSGSSGLAMRYPTPVSVWMYLGPAWRRRSSLARSLFTTPLHQPGVARVGIPPDPLQQLVHGSLPPRR